MVAAVGPEEALVRARQLLAPVGVQGLDPLVVGAAATLVVQPPLQVAVAGDAGGECPDVVLELAEIGAEGIIDQADLDRLAGSDRGERAPVSRAAVARPTRLGSRYVQYSEPYRPPMCW